MLNDLLTLREKLCEACDENDLNTCRKLLNHLDPNFEIEGYQTPLICAILADNTDIVELLIDHGASLEPPEGYVSMLQYTKHHTEFLDVGVRTRKLLFRKGLDPDYMVNGTTAFMDAINHGYFELAEEYLNANARIDVVDKTGWTPVNRILSIISNNSRDMFEDDVFNERSYLENFNLKYASKITSDDLLSFAQLDWGMFIAESDAYRENRREPGIRLLKRLIEKGADVSTANEYGWTPLLYASGSEYLFEICVLLIEAGADVNCVDKLGQYTPIKRAFDTDHPELELLLLRRGADLRD
jgi:ankyrin repeat protein